jgi:hypothetical protein
MSEIVSLSLSTDNEMVSHLCKFLRLGDSETDEVMNAVASEVGFGFASVAHVVDIKHKTFATWQRRVVETLHFREIVHGGFQRGFVTQFDVPSVATELGFQAMLEVFIAADDDVCMKPLVQWIDRLSFSFCVYTWLPVARLRDAISEKMEKLDTRVRVTAVTAVTAVTVPFCNKYKIQCEIAEVWGLPVSVIALANVSDENIVVVPFSDGTFCPCVDRIDVTLLGAAPAVDKIRKCKFRGVVVKKWRGGRHTGRDRSAARALVSFSMGSCVFK